MCIACLRSQVDITEGIPKQATLYFCRGCERYLQGMTEWVYCTLESRELLSLCLKKLKGRNRVKLVDASFVWTEPHSKRIKVSFRGIFFFANVMQIRAVIITDCCQLKKKKTHVPKKSFNWLITIY